MQLKWTIGIAATTAAVGGMTFLADPPVNLQAATPGTAQNGHLNLTGTARAGFFKGDGGQITGLNASAMNQGVLTLTGSSATYMIRGSNSSGAANATGVIGLANSATGVTYGGWFESKSTSGRALFGYASAPTGATYGVYGVAQGTGGRAMFGLANSSSGINYGGWFQSNSSTGIGAYARNTNGGVGLRAESAGMAIQSIGSANFNGGFVSIGPSTAPVYPEDVFGLNSNTSGFVGMYIRSGTGGIPYYGYNNGTFDVFTQLDSGGTWSVNNGTASLSFEQNGMFTAPSLTTATAAITTLTAPTISGETLNVSTLNGKALNITNAGLDTALIVDESNTSKATHGMFLSTVTGAAALYSVNNSPTGAGIISQANANQAVFAQNSSATDSSILGQNSAQGGVCVKGTAIQDGIGVFGFIGVAGETAGFAVRGDVGNDTGTLIGVYGKATGNDQFAVYAQGKMTATGAKTFLIDHPEDPENKMLFHYCTEGSEPLNQYTGNAVTDSEGSAWVRLPTYVEKINRDFRYQLTVIGDFAQAIVGQEIRAGIFQIRTNKPNIKVSWQVQGVRNDKWMQKHGSPDEVDKPQTWKGKYLSPDLYNKSPESGVFYRKPSSIKHVGSKK